MYAAFVPSMAVSPRRGFTLIEILAVVVILGIASVLVIPNLGTRNDQYVAAASRVVMADLMYAQSQAIVTQNLVYVNFNTGAQQYSLTTTAPNVTPVVYVTNPMTNSNYTTVFSSSTVPQLQLDSFNAPSFGGTACLAFDELGQPYSVNVSSGAATLLSANGTVPLVCGSNTITVNVEPYSGALSAQ
jgi:prepilin-type N-terminal cleavage/methylation domain-containing protein